MEKYRNPTVVKVIIVITLVMFAIASLSPDFMSAMLGTDVGPFISFVYETCLVGGQAFGWTIGQTKEAGVFVMLALLMLLLIFYILYRIFRSIYRKYTRQPSQ